MSSNEAQLALRRHGTFRYVIADAAAIATAKKESERKALGMNTPGDSLKDPPEPSGLSEFLQLLLAAFRWSRPNWSKLPRNLGYLRGPAEKWGVFQSYEEIDAFANEITPGEMEELTALAKRVRESGDEKLAIEWMEVYPYIEHPESALVHALLELLNEIVPREWLATERHAP